MKKFYISAIFFSTAFLVLSSVLIYGACCGRAQREPGCPNEDCNYERLGGRCNSDSECCPGKQCTAFGYCEPCNS